ncbi:ATP-binding protein [Acidithiobacillus thiooxidans]|uniref:ATP-binding protein n=1 Tax=Acidithiobacillus thiooxidans TaxID=930 RepID=UPI00285D8AF3|nr:ATP-binding protein [Acidithiobacillus thiooxidans]MDR7928311.1 ATP-binding protein [Acidithiobacillus thiooxidans]
MTTRDDVTDLPEYRDNPFIAKLPHLLSAHEALQTMAEPPKFNEIERGYAAHLRAHCVLRLKNYFEPLGNHLQLEAKFSMLLRQGYLSRNPNTTDYIHRLQDGYERVVGKDLAAVRRPIRSTASSFALIGCSGIGKSYGMARVLERYPQVVHHAEPFSLDQVVWLKLDSPYKGSPKQLCISFFQEMDNLLGTHYRARYGASRSSLDEMMVQMAQIANLHALGVLIVDEIQHIKEAPGTGADALLNFLVTLVNTIGIPVIVIGTLGALPLLQGDFRQARRASGLGSLVWERMEVGATWNHFVDRMWSYQWTREVSPLTDEIRQALYEESQGIVDVLVNLFMMAQLRALELGVLRDRPERIDAGLLRQVAHEHLRLIHPMIDALKRNDREAIAKYDDIRPLHDHARQVFGDSLARLSDLPSMTAHMPAVSAAEDDTCANDDDGRILGALDDLGLPRDIAKVLLAEVRAENQGLSPMGIVGVISTKLQGQESATPQTAKTRRSVARAKTGKAQGPSDEQDLRIIIAAGKKDGLPAYEALLGAGVIKPPMADRAG